MNTTKSESSLDWANFIIEADDLDLIYNYLLEKETPMTPPELAKTIISERISIHKKNVIDKVNKAEIFYRPQKQYQVGDTIEFPASDNIKGCVTAVRDGKNPDLGTFSVISVQMGDGSDCEFASGLKEHKLNDFDYSNSSQEDIDANLVMKNYGKSIAKKIISILKENDDLICIAGFWFPQALLAEVNPGYLNLAEAVLEMEEGRPVSTASILEQIGYPKDSNSKLTEFSFNYALQKDNRFDEVGPVGQVLWTLKELEPEDVRKIPMTLKYLPIETTILDFDDDIFSNVNLCDELESDLLIEPEQSFDSFDICLNYPHWKAGTLPLLGSVRSIFPTAMETDNVIFMFHDIKNNVDFPGWVIISKNYVCGLKQWYRKNNIIPGSVFRISHDEKFEIVNLDLLPPRASKDWIRSATLNDKCKVSFVTRQHQVTTDFDERMSLFVENSPQLDTLWENNNRVELSPKKQVDLIFNELSKDNPQGIVHFLELYAALNMLRRFPPRTLFSMLLQDETLQHIEGFYFKVKETSEA